MFMRIIWTIIVGLVVGGLARWFYPGPVPMAWWLTALLGIAGSFVGGLIGNLLWRSPTDRIQPAGLFLSVIGAMLVIWLASYIPH
jgi:uncharacterized membrane protein YeaQ/YmgE (transglycosylase-associated protein family)